MNKTTLGVIVAAFLLAPGVSNAQVSKDARKAHQEIVKASKKELNEKATKAARKEAKRLSKEGWESAPGALPIEKQLDRSYTMQYQYDEDGFPKYIMAEAMSIGGNYDAAKIQAIELAKQNLASQIQTELTALVENTVANNQLGAEQAESLTKSVVASKNLISQSLGRVISVTEVYRTLKNKNKEVLVKIAYDSEKAMNLAKNAVRKDLEDRGDSLHNKLDEILGW